MLFKSFYNEIKLYLLLPQMIRIWQTTVQEIRHRIMSNRLEGEREELADVLKSNPRLDIVISKAHEGDFRNANSNECYDRIPGISDCCCSGLDGNLRLESRVTDYWQPGPDGMLRLDSREPIVDDKTPTTCGD